MTPRPTWMDEASTMENLSNAQVIAEVEQLLGTARHADIAARLGASTSGLETRLRRAGRPDLAEPFMLARAAERAAGALP